MPMNDETKAALQSLWDEQDDRRKKRFQHLEAEFKDDQKSLTDRDRLEWIGLIVGMVSRLEIEPPQHFERLVTQLSFANETVDPENLKTAWKKFLTSESSSDSPSFPPEWDSTCDRVMAHCFEQRGKTTHSISVYEHILSEIVGGDPNYRDSVYRDSVESCLFKLFDYYAEQKPSRRAREILTLITTYNENGFISDDRYYAVLPKETELFYREMGEAVGQDRHLAEERLRLEMMNAFDKLTEITRSYLIDAELWSNDRMRKLEPSAGPRRWVLAVESEFHHKLFQQNRAVLERALQGNSPKSLLRPEQSCSIGQIALLVRKAGSGRPENALVTAVFRNLRGSQKFAGAQLDIPEVMPKHRERFAHVTKGGPYTREECNDFIREVRDSEWVHQFLLALQPD